MYATKGEQLQKWVFVFPAVAALLLAAFTPTLSAEEKSDGQSAWEFYVAPFVWALAADGNVTVKGIKADVDMSFNDIRDQLNVAAMVEYGGRKGNWGVWGHTFYANLGKDTKVAGIKIDPTIKIWWQVLGGSYRLGTWHLSDAPGKKAPAVTVDTYFGGRYTHLGVRFDIKGFPNRDGDKQWVEPLIGLSTLWDLSERWSLQLKGDIGGIAFGSDFAWDAIGLIGYRFPLFSKENNAAVFAGYRALHQDYTDGSGDDKFKWDVTLDGPILGLKIDF
jgi:hypothetical protein